MSNFRKLEQLGFDVTINKLSNNDLVAEISFLDIHILTAEPVFSDYEYLSTIEDEQLYKLAEYTISEQVDLKELINSLEQRMQIMTLRLQRQSRVFNKGQL